MMSKKVRSTAFAEVLTRALVDFKAAVERGDQTGANLQYTLVCGLIAGATLSGGIGKRAGVLLLAKTNEARLLLMASFGEAPDVLG